MKVKLKIIAAAVLLLCAMSLTAMADDVTYETVYETVYVDPATLHIGNPAAGGDPNVVNLNFGVSQNSGGAAALNNPWLLILGVPNTTAANPFGAITTLSSSAGGATSSTYLGLKGTLSAGQEAYAQLGLANDTNSNNFGNWATAEHNISNITANSFGLYEFNINATLAGKDVVSFVFADLPTGTIAIAYGQTGAISSSQTCTTKKGKTTCTTTVTNTITIYDTPWTEAAFSNHTPRIPHVPEPASLALLGAGMTAMVSFLRRRSK